MRAGPRLANPERQLHFPRVPAGRGRAAKARLQAVRMGACISALSLLGAPCPPSSAAASRSLPCAAVSTTRTRRPSSGPLPPHQGRGGACRSREVAWPGAKDGDAGFCNLGVILIDGIFSWRKEGRTVGLKMKERFLTQVERASSPARNAHHNRETFSAHFDISVLHSSPAFPLLPVYPL